MNDAVITWIAGEKFCKLQELWVFIESLDNSGFSGKKIVFTHDMDIETEYKLLDRNYQVIHINPNHIDCLVRDRFIFYRKFLLENLDLRYVLLLDSKDVVIQEDPIPLLIEIDKDLIFVSEGIKHGQSMWNSNDQKKYQNNTIFKLPYDDWDVINCGTIIGKPKELANLALNIWSSHSVSDKQSTEQATLNYLVRHYSDFPDCKIVHPNEDNLALTGEAVKYDFIKPERINNKVVCPKNKKPYCIFHQWERTRFKDIYL